MVPARVHAVSRFATIVLFAAAAAALGDDAAGHGADAPPPSDPWAGVAVVPLWQAVKSETVEATGSSPKSYTALEIKLTNTSKSRVAVDLAGSHLRPRERGRCQRLGIGPPVLARDTERTGPGTSIVRLEAGATVEFVVRTCCLDAGKACPSKESFVAEPEALPAVRESVLRWWTDNPTTPQIAVNSAIWSNSPTVRVTPGVVENFVEPKGRFAATRGGTYFRLVDGELTSLDSEGVLRVLGGGIFQVLPTDDAVYSVMLGDNHKPKLWRLGMTGERVWSQVLDLDGANRIREIIPGRGADLLLVTDAGIDFFDAETKLVIRALETAEFPYLSVHRPAGADTNRLVVSSRRPPVLTSGQVTSAPVFEIWHLDLATGKAERADSYWNQQSVLAGPGGVFALSHTEGRLRRLVRDKFEWIGPVARYRRLVAVAKDVVWLADEEDRLVAVDARNGRERFVTPVRSEEAKNFTFDPATGDFAYVDGTQFMCLRGSDGTQTSIVAR